MSSPSTHLATQSSRETIAQFERYVIPNYRRFPVCLVRGEGSWIWDAEGHRYLDFFPGWGCNLLGHCPRARRRGSPRPGRPVDSRSQYLVHGAARGAGGSSSRSGRSAGSASSATAGPRPTRPPSSWRGAHGHGRGDGSRSSPWKGASTAGPTAALSATAQPKYHEGFEPMVPGFAYVPFNDLEAVAATVDEQTAAVLVEPIQGEGGINIPGPGYLPGLRNLCDERGVLLILDEVQTGMGRTGEWFAYQHQGVEPDILTCAKALAGGLAAGVMMARQQVAEMLKPGMHASTFGGNPIACRAALAAIETIEAENLLERAAAIAARFREQFEALRAEIPDLFRDIRILGTMIGLDLTFDAGDIVNECLSRRLLVNVTHGHVVRLLPALTITDEQIDEGCAILADVLRNVVV